MKPRKLVLIAEDEKDTANLLQYRLHKNGYRTKTAADGREALNAVFADKPDLVILDLMMPQLHGYEVCRLLKSNSTTCHIPVIILTAMAAQEDKLRGFKLGAEDYVTKPFDIRELLARVNALLRRDEGDFPERVGLPSGKMFSIL